MAESVKRVKASQLRVGMYVSLDRVKWLDHPFLFSSFKIKNEKQLEALRDLGVAEFDYLPGKSDAEPLAVDEKAAAAAPAGADEQEKKRLMDELWHEKRERIERLTKQKERVQSCEKQYVKTAASLKSVMKGLFSRPDQALEEAQNTISDLVQSFMTDQNVVVHLMSNKVAEENVHYHALNVMILSLILAREAQLDLTEMNELGVGALLHDVGKIRIPSQIIQKTDPLTKAEQDFYQLHAQYGAEIAARIAGIPRGVLDIIHHHHEAHNGRGYPDHLAGDRISKLTSIVAIVNTYDNHCNRVNPSESMTPAEAMSFMFKNQGAQFEPNLLKLFIRCLGIYPPGTVVQLSNDRIGLVVAVDSSNLLRPSVLMYDSHVPRQDAVIFDMRDDPDLSIVRTIRPNKLPQEVYEYLSPRTRISYFIDKDGQRVG